MSDEPWDVEWPHARKQAFATDQRRWFEAYVAAGFKPAEALALLTRPVVTIQPIPVPPEFMEMAERMNVWLTRDLTEGNP